MKNNNNSNLMNENEVDAKLDQLPLLSNEQNDMIKAVQEELIVITQNKDEWNEKDTEQFLSHFSKANVIRRYMRAYRWDNGKVVNALIETYKWQEEFGALNLVENHYETLQHQTKTGKLYVYGHDRVGRPIVFMHPGRETRDQRNHLPNIQNFVYTMTRAVGAMDEEKGVEKMIMVLDMTGYSIWNAPSWKTSHLTWVILSHHFCERLHRAYILQAPFVFRTFWKLIKPLLDEVTLSKVVFVDATTPEERLKQLRLDLDDDQIISAIGGENNWDFTNEGEFERYWAEDVPLKL